jgi:hypothetical protein
MYFMSPAVTTIGPSAEDRLFSHPAARLPADPAELPSTIITTTTSTSQVVFPGRGVISQESRKVHEPPPGGSLTALQQGIGERENPPEVATADQPNPAWLGESGQRAVSDPEVCVPRCWETPWEFASHAVVGIAIFLIMAVPAVCLDLLVRSLETHGIGSVIFFCLKTAEYALVGADLVLFLAFLWRTVRRTIPKL